MRRNGSMTAHGREWPLYERREVRDGRTVMVLSQPPEDRIEKERLDEIAFELERRGRATMQSTEGIKAAKPLCRRFSSTVNTKSD